MIQLKMETSVILKLNVKEQMIKTNKIQKINMSLLNKLLLKVRTGRVCNQVTMG